MYIQNAKEGSGEGRESDKGMCLSPVAPAGSGGAGWQSGAVPAAGGAVTEEGGGADGRPEQDGAHGL